MSKISIANELFSGNLNFKTAQKMIHGLLTCMRIKTHLDDRRVLHGVSKIKLPPFTKQELANKLGISQEEFVKLEFPSFYNSIANKVTLSLVKLYCSTKFADDEYEKLTNC